MVFGTLGVGLAFGDDVWLGLPTGNVRVDVGALVSAVTGQDWTLPGRGDDGDDADEEIDVWDKRPPGEGGEHGDDCFRMCMLAGFCWGLGGLAGIGLIAAGLRQGVRVVVPAFGLALLALSVYQLVNMSLKCMELCGLTGIPDALAPRGER